MDVVVSYLHMGETALLLLWSPGTELFESIELYLGDGLEIAIHWRHWGRLGTAHLWFRSPKNIGLQIDMIVLLR